MSKYNLTDIFEQYQIGSGWTNDFDYDGMLNAGLKVSVDTNIETLKKLAEDFTDVNYHREASHLYDAIEAIEGGNAFEAGGKLNDFFAEIRQTQEDQGMDTSDDLGAYMASKMEEGEAVDLAIEASQEKAGIKEDKYDDIVDADDDIPAGKKKAAALAYRKVDKGASYEKATSHIKEKEEKKLPMDEIAGYDRKGNKQKDTDGSNASKYKRAAMDVEEDSISGEDDYAEELSDKMRMKEALPKFKGVPPMRDIVKALKDDAKATDSEIKQFMASVKKAGDEFDDVDDYVEDFKNYVADKSLQEKQYAPEVVDRIEMVRKALYDTNNFDAKEIEAYTRSIVSDFERGDFEAYDDFKADDYVEDIKNYISDKALQEHFGRFMKDYQ